MTRPTSHCLFIFRHAPYASGIAREGLDMALAFAAFEQSVTLLFLDDGIWQLLPQQQTQLLQTKNIEQLLQVLPHYDITHVYTLTECLQERNMTPSQLNVPVKCIARAELASWLSQFTRIFTF